MRTNKSFSNEEIEEWAQEIWDTIVRNGDQKSRVIISATVSADTRFGFASAEDSGLVAGRLLSAVKRARSRYWQEQRAHELFLTRWG